MIEVHEPLDPDTVPNCETRAVLTWCLRSIACGILLVCGACRSTTISVDRYRDAPVVLISIDTLRADHLRLYGYKPGSTPILDRLAAIGIVFDDVYSHSPLTLAVHTRRC